MTDPTRFPYGGISNNLPTETLAQYGLPDPTKWHTYFNDFDVYAAGDWTITETGSGTRALAEGGGGLLLITNAAADNDANFFQLVKGGFLLSSTKKALFRIGFKVSDATQSDIVAGLYVIDTTPLSVTDGIFFQKDDGDAQIDVYVRKNATTGNINTNNVGTLVDDTFINLGWYYDGGTTALFFINNAVVARLDASSTYLPDTTLAVSFGIQNGEGVAKTMTMDYVFAAVER